MIRRTLAWPPIIDGWELLEPSLEDMLSGVERCLNTSIDCLLTLIRDLQYWVVDVSSMSLMEVIVFI